MGEEWTVRERPQGLAADSTELVRNGLPVSAHVAASELSRLVAEVAQLRTDLDAARREARQAYAIGDDMVLKLEAQAAAMRAALEWYADPLNHTDGVMSSKRARAALEGDAGRKALAVIEAARGYILAPAGTGRMTLSRLCAELGMALAKLDGVAKGAS
jgi:multidrug resistance efflux pump